MQKHYLAVTEGAIPVNAIEQTWIFEPRENARVGRTAPSLANNIVKTMNWLGHLGSGRIVESRLESRHGIHHDLRAKSIGL